MKPLVREGEWNKFLKSIDDDEYPEEHIRKYNETVLLCTLVNDYRKFACRGRRKNFLAGEEKFRMIKEIRHSWTAEKRFLKKAETHWKEKNFKLEGVDWLQIVRMKGKY
jgi:hypothetical protein